MQTNAAQVAPVKTHFAYVARGIVESIFPLEDAQSMADCKYFARKMTDKGVKVRIVRLTAESAASYQARIDEVVSEIHAIDAKLATDLEGWDLRSWRDHNAIKHIRALAKTARDAAYAKLQAIVCTE